MHAPRRILMLVNWQVRYTDSDLADEQPSNKVVKGEKYWFFKYWDDEDTKVDVVDYTRLAGIHPIERRLLKFYVSQPIRVLPRIAGYDLIVSHSAQSGVLLALMRSLAGRKKPPHVVIDPGSFNGGRQRTAELLPIRMSLPSLAGVIGHSRSQVAFYRDVLHLKPERFRVVHVGVDTRFYSPDQNNEEEDYVLCLGYMKRDWKTLIEAWKGLKTETRLLVLGREGVGDGVPGVDSIGYVPRLRMKELILKARFVVIPLPYYTYSFGQMSLLISQALGKATVVTRVPGLLDYGEDGRTHIFVEPYSAEDMREKLALLLSHPGSAREMGAQARASVVSKYSDRQMGYSLKEAIDGFCENV